MTTIGSIRVISHNNLLSKGIESCTNFQHSCLHNNKYFSTIDQKDDIRNMKGYYDSNENDENESLLLSNRRQFNQIPINPSILNYIESIGVGLRPMRKKSKLIYKKKTTTRGRKDQPQNLLQEEDESSFFANDKRRYGKTKKPNGHTTATRTRDGKRSSTSAWLPPPPFSSSIKDEGGNESVNEYVCLPVKIIGSAGSFEDKMPRPSKGLPEVALAGRSNVGKSTLLNALLYGNRFTDVPENRTFVRGKTPVGAKLPKGSKAIVSNKPGETKQITFYQLSCNVLKKTKEQQQQQLTTTREEKEIVATNDEKEKMSLVLVDLPGYGFAYTSEEKASEWKRLMNDYIWNRSRKSLKRVLLLLDARHGFKKTDYEFLTSLDSDGKVPPIQLVLTKCDLVSQNDLARRVIQVKEQFSSIFKRQPSSLPVMLVSAKAGLGFNNIRKGNAKGGILELQRELAALVPKP